MSFFELITNRIKLTNCPICVGLDPHSGELKEHNCDNAFAFCTHIIDETKDKAACYKPNSAFFEELEGGMECLQKVINYIPKEIPVILDFKRGDISTTAIAYAKTAKRFGVKCVTLNGYMGFDSIKPFLDENIDAFVLCKTSNPSSDEIQCLPIAGREKRFVFEEVAEYIKKWDSGNHLGLVVGSTDTDSLKRVRKICPNHWILSPGIGAQGGDLEESVRVGMRSDHLGIIFNVSRGISHAKDIKLQMNEYIENIKTAQDFTVPSTGALLDYQREFIDFAIEHDVLKFGSFTLKSGRKSPFFFNAGCFSTGEAMSKLSYYYYCALKEKKLDFDIIFGPAYKGINLAAALSMTIDREEGKSTPFAYNRKETKEHGEGDLIVGANVKGKKILLIDDVITAGTAINESISLLTESTIVGVILCLDRQEKGKDTNESAVAQISKKYNIPVICVIQLNHIIEYLREKKEKVDELTRLMEYRKEYGSS